MLNEEKIALLNVGDELYVGVIYKPTNIISCKIFLVMIQKQEF